MLALRPSPAGTIVTGLSIWASVTQDGIVQIIALIVAVPFTIWISVCLAHFIIGNRSTVIRALGRLRKRSGLRK
ncbi:MAG TPA: hypothetical protein G4O13_07865 [Dehalococcoidia bacterium]|nr:hypothetical protein [Dehalococcoidia bacterium]